MATATVLQFSSRDPMTGEPIWPAQISTAVTIPGSMVTSPGMAYVSVSADADCRMGINYPATTSSTPIISATYNPFIIAPGGAETLSFV